METYEYVQVSGGKFHRPAETTRERAAWFQPMAVRCGKTIEPVNVFPTRDEALDYMGGREHFLCARCEASDDATYVTPGHPVKDGAGYDCQCGRCLHRREIKRGFRFTHDTFLDTDWQPAQGQKYADAPHAEMVVTRATTTHVWYGHASGGLRYVLPRDEFVSRFC